MEKETDFIIKKFQNHVKQSVCVYHICVKLPEKNSESKGGWQIHIPLVANIFGIGLQNGYKIQLCLINIRCRFYFIQNCRNLIDESAMTIHLYLWKQFLKKEVFFIHIFKILKFLSVFTSPHLWYATQSDWQKEVNMHTQGPK